MYALATLPVVFIATSLGVANRKHWPPFAPASLDQSSAASASATAAPAPTQMPLAAPSGSAVAIPPPVATASANVETMSKNEFVDYAKSTVVSITVSYVFKTRQREKSYFAGRGTGFFVSSDGLIATARKVVTNDLRLDQIRRFSVKTEEGATYNSVWRVGDDSRNEIALLRIRRKGTPFLKLSSTPKAPESTAIMVISQSRFLEKLSVIQGTVTGHDKVEGREVDLVDARVGGAAWGAPLVMTDSRDVIGVIQGDMGWAGMNYALRVEPLRKLMAEASNNDGDQCGSETTSDGWRDATNK